MADDGPTFSDKEVASVIFVQRHWRGLQADRAQPLARLYVFRGVRSVRGRPVAELDAGDEGEVPAKGFVKSECGKEPLLYAGHVGLSIDGGRTIFAWNPVLPAEFTTGQALDALKGGASYPGILTDDTNVFTKAQLYHVRHGWNTRITVVRIGLTWRELAQCAGVVARVLAQRAGEHGWYYSFPKKVGAPAAKTANCATFPSAYLGLPVPDLSGQMFSYAKKSRLEELEQGFASILWAGKGAHAVSVVEKVGMEPRSSRLRSFPKVNLPALPALGRLPQWAACLRHRNRYHQRLAVG